MITNLVIGLITTFVNAIDGLLPHATVPAFLLAGNIIPSASENLIAAALYAINVFFPSTTLLEIFAGVLALWPFVAAYTVFDWVYRHIPSVAGFGLGAG